MKLETMDKFDDDIRLSALFRGAIALCRETGAFLSRTNGRSKAGSGQKYVLVLPSESPEERGGFFRYSYSTALVKRIRAWSDQEAIDRFNLMPPQA